MTTMITRIVPSCLVVALAGCDAPAPEGQATPAPEAGSPAPSTAPASAEAGAAEAARTSEAADAPEPAVAGKSVEPAPTPAAPSEALHVIARSGTEMGVHPLVDGSLLASAGPLVLRVDERGELVHDPAMLRGLKSIRASISPDGTDFEGVHAWGPVALGGRWPDAVYLSLDVVSGFRGEGGVPAVHRWDGQAWVTIGTRSRHYDWYPAEVHPWIEGSLLARRVFQEWYPGQEEWDESQGPTKQQVAAAHRAIAQAKPIVVIRGAPKAPATAATAVAFTSRPTGEVFVVTGDEPASLVRIDAAGASHTVALPGDGFAHGVIADGPDRAWVFGVAGDEPKQPWLVRIEGDGATQAEAPGCQEIGMSSLAVLDDGTQWATCGDPPRELHAIWPERYSLWQRAPGEAWTQKSLPTGVDRPRTVVARAADDVWVSARDQDGGVVLHSRPRSKVLELPGLDGLGRQVLEWNDPVPFDGRCSWVYIPLRTPPAEADAVKAALDEPMKSLALANAVVLTRSTYRGVEELGLELVLPDDTSATKRVMSTAYKVLGKEALGVARCWSVEEEEGWDLATWGGEP